VEDEEEDEADEEEFNAYCKKQLKASPEASKSGTAEKAS
jgi:hypothetical protein